jgi:hypothetical protein
MVCGYVKSYPAIFAAAVIVAAVGALAGTGPRGSADHDARADNETTCVPRWRTIPTPALTNGALIGVAARTPNDVWAVGRARARYREEDLVSAQPLIEHWDGRRWTIVPGPRVQGLLTGVAMASVDDVWAVGRTLHYEPSAPDVAEGLSEGPLVARWDGASWSTIDVPTETPLNAVSLSGSSDVWAVGTAHPYRDDREEGYTSVILRWDGTRWATVETPRVRLEDVVAISSRDVWVVGEVAMHWNGRRWRTYRLPRLGGTEWTGTQLGAVTAISASDIWAVGSAVHSITGYAVLLHWNGQRWAIRARPQPEHFWDVAARSRGELWIAGGDSFQAGGQEWLLRRTRSTSTTFRLEKKHELSALARDSRTNLWAVGSTGPRIDSDGNPILGKKTPLAMRYGC